MAVSLQQGVAWRMAACAAAAACALGSATAQGRCERTVSRPDERYDMVKGSPGEVRDIPSTLIWQRCLAGMAWDAAAGRCSGTALSLNWEAAQVYAASLPKQGTAWRVPTHLEWLTLVDLACSDPAVNPRWFGDTPNQTLWSGSPYQPLADYAWGINMRNGVLSYESKTEQYPFRLVRSAP